MTFRLLILSLLIALSGVASAETIGEAQLPSNTRVLMRFAVKELAPVVHALPGASDLKLPIDLSKVTAVTLAASSEHDAVLLIETSEAARFIEGLRDDPTFTTVTYQGQAVYHIITKNEDMADLLEDASEALEEDDDEDEDDPGAGVEEEDDFDDDDEEDRHPVYFSIPRDGLMVMADDLSVLTRQLDILKGTRQTLAQNPTPAVKASVDGSPIFYVQFGKGLRELKDAGIDSAKIRFDQDAGKVRLHAEFEALDGPSVAKIQGMIDVGRSTLLTALGMMDQKDRVTLQKALDALKVDTKDRTVTVSLEMAR